MVAINNIQQSPSLKDFINEVRQEEENLQCFEVPAYRFKLYEDGKLGIDTEELSGRFGLSEKALSDLAQTIDVHKSFFVRCDMKLRSMICNYLLSQKVPAEKQLSIIMQDQEVIHIIQNSNLLFARRAPILDTVSNAMPQQMRKEDLKAIVYQWNGKFDVSIIAPNLQCKPKKDDIVAFGVNVAQGRDGSVQIQGAAFRLACSNGVISRICDSRRHRLRRPADRANSQSQFLDRISVFAAEAWRQYPLQIEELRKLTEVPLDKDYVDAMRSRLRQAPFFLSLRIVNQVLERLQLEIAQHDDKPSLYDLWNAMSYLGSHRHELSYTYRSRLRCGAGEFIRHQSRVCDACRQLVLR